MAVLWLVIGNLALKGQVILMDKFWYYLFSYQARIANLPWVLEARKKDKVFDLQAKIVEAKAEEYARKVGRLANCDKLAYRN